MVNTFSIEIAKSLVESSEQFPVNFNDAWQWLEYSRKDTAKNHLINNFIEGVDYVRVHINMEYDNHEGFSAQEKAVLSRKEDYRLSVDCFKCWAMMAKTEKGKEVRLYFLECEKIAKQSQNPNMDQLMSAFQDMKNDLSSQLASQLVTQLMPIQKELSELRVISTALSSSNGIQKQINAQACNDFSDYQMLTFNDVVKKFRPYFAKVPKIVSRARHSVGKVFATEQERELGKISGKYIFSGWEIQTAINCLDRAAKEIFVEYEDSTLPLMDLIEKMDKDNKELI